MPFHPGSTARPEDAAPAASSMRRNFTGATKAQHEDVTLSKVAYVKTLSLPHYRVLGRPTSAHRAEYSGLHHRIIT